VALATTAIVALAATATTIGVTATTATTAIVALAATATTIGVTATTATTIGVTATTATTTGVALAAAAAATSVALAATAAATDKRNYTGSGIAFQDRHRGCLGRPRYKTCGEQSAREGSRHG
jgi:hypothetical protein